MIWKILTLLALVTPVAMVVLGLICWRFPPGGPNWVLGFRSRRARAGDASWKFAQNWTGRLWFGFGLIWLVTVLLISLDIQELPIEDSIVKYMNLVGLQAASLILLIFGMNVALIIRFDRFGRLRKKNEKRKKITPESNPPQNEEDTEPFEDDFFRDDYYAGSEDPAFDDGDDLSGTFDDDAPEDPYGEYDPDEDEGSLSHDEPSEESF